MTDKRDYCELPETRQNSCKKTKKEAADDNHLLIGHSGRCFDVRSQPKKELSSNILSASEGYILYIILFI